MLDRERAIWAIRCFLDREPGDKAEIEFHRDHPDLGAMRKAFALTAEFRQFLGDIGVIDAAARHGPYRAPRSLLEPSSAPNISTRFTPPTLAEPVSQLCTY